MAADPVMKWLAGAVRTLSQKVTILEREIQKTKDDPDPAKPITISLFDALRLKDAAKTVPRDVQAQAPAKQAEGMEETIRRVMQGVSQTEMQPIIRAETQPMCEHVKWLTSQSQQQAESNATYTLQIDALKQQLADSRKEFKILRGEMQGLAAVQKELVALRCGATQTATPAEEVHLRGEGGDFRQIPHTAWETIYKRFSDSVPERSGLVKHSAGETIIPFQAKTPTNVATGEQRFDELWMKENQVARRELEEWSLEEQLRIDDDEFEEFCAACDDATANEIAILAENYAKK